MNLAKFVSVMTTVPQPGDYVLATKWSGGDPCEPFAVGFLSHIKGDRFHVVDKDGKTFRAGGYRRCEKITYEIGDVIVAAMPVISDRPGRSLWYWRYHPAQLARMVEALK